MKLQVLVTTMHQSDFSKFTQMNLQTDAVIANQTDRNEYTETEINGCLVQLISTNTKGVGINRNICLMYADHEICLLADDDMVYVDDLEEIVVSEFDKNPEADIIIFNVHTADDTLRKQKAYTSTRKCGRFERMPWGGVRIAFRLSSVKKANIWFSTLFGGGAMFASGEDSIWLKEARRKGLCFYVSKEFIGTVSFDTSTWYSGRDEKLFFGRGAYISQMNPKSFLFWKYYYAFRFSKNAKIDFAHRLKWIDFGRNEYKEMMTYEEFIKRKEIELHETV